MLLPVLRAERNIKDHIVHHDSSVSNVIEGFEQTNLQEFKCQVQGS